MIIRGCGQSLGVEVDTSIELGVVHDAAEYRFGRTPLVERLEQDRSLLDANAMSVASYAGEEAVAVVAAVEVAAVDPAVDASLRIAVSDMLIGAYAGN